MSKFQPFSITKEQEQRSKKIKTRDEILVPLLAQRSFHLPGNTWKEDWVQWMRNNHIVFGTCFHHPLHPIETWERMVVLLGSISFAMVATNIGYVWDWYDGEDHHFDPSEVVYQWNVTRTSGVVGDDDAGDSSYTTVDITYGTLILWTFGCTFHSIFDFLVWNLSACACFNAGGRYGKTGVAARCHDLGSYLLIPFVLGLLGLAGYSSYLRVTSGNTSLEEEYEDDLIGTLTEGKLGEYSFLIRFGVELLLAWFVFFPLVSTIFFSGLLGCNRLPLLGGRPRDKRVLEEDLKDTIVFSDDRTSYVEF